MLLASFGGPEGQDDVLPFLRNVTRGRGIPDERLEEVSHHYRANGGISPINQQNRELKAAMEAELAARGIGLPVFWRPKVMVACRLYYLKSQKTKSTFSVTQKMPWGELGSRQLTWRAIFRFRPPFDAEDMNRLLYIACQSLLVKLRKEA